MRVCAPPHADSGIVDCSFHKNEKTKGQYFNPSKRGAKFLFTAEEELLLEKSVDKLRKEGTAVDSSLVAAQAKGIFQKTHSSLLQKQHGGIYCFSNMWAKRFLARTGFGVYHGTTDRCIPASEIVDQAEGYFKSIREVGSREHNTYNMDEWRTPWEITAKSGE